MFTVNFSLLKVLVMARKIPMMMTVILMMLIDHDHEDNNDHDHDILIMTMMKRRMLRSMANIECITGEPSCI